ncbi:MaoC family dehydratase [Priestia taiwanensis]|uniref:3-hydroxybutyryl-CoA dehydratase n=1 Tax=Priestia taiwanensis TaxID=1347902 RepID=A0A917AT59_9BACI|nr:MaoC family dehydratase [Priestia taiwanensis]MBM7364026.1 3-hydroxybutyryl-CoA dehydratase [Priestia taiwanensis]GGE71069.1 3-hydroxybutyryl-CoA dehydratase [Priestia taiwanensis]
MDILHKATLVQERKYEDIHVGDKALFSHTITNEDIQTFATLTGDVNPIHLLDDFAKDTIFKERIAHGMLVSSYISTILGTDLPGKNTIYLSQSVSFKAPVKINDTITVVVEVLTKRDDKKIVTLQTNVYNQHDTLVVEGTASIKKLG